MYIQVNYSDGRKTVYACKSVVYERNPLRQEVIQLRHVTARRHQGSREIDADNFGTIEVVLSEVSTFATREQDFPEVR